VKEDKVDFIKCLYDEKLKTQENRRELIKLKIMFIIALSGLGSVNIKDLLNLYQLFYFIPFISIAFDLYISGEDFSIKRIGAFLKSKSSVGIEKEWEIFVTGYRDYMSFISTPLLSSIVLCGCFFVIIANEKELKIHQIIWLSIVGITIISISLLALFFRFKLNRYFENNPESRRSNKKR
jgi:hypothetical protein